MSNLLAGFAEVDYTPWLGLKLRGQHRVRIAKRVRDPLMANAVAMRQGAETVIIASIDICFLSTEFITSIQTLFQERTGVCADRLLIHATHSHVAPSAIPYHWADVDQRFLAKLREDILTAATSALQNIEPVQAFSGSTQLDRLNWNRRSMYSDGTSEMHGSANRPDYIGTEGSRDPNLGVIYFRNERGEIPGVIASFGTHPNCVDNEEFYSADLPGEVRRLLKAMLGGRTGIVYLTGAAGNVTPVIREPGRTQQPWMGEEGLQRAGLYLAGAIASTVAAAVEPISSPNLAVLHESLQIPIRPYPEPDDASYPKHWSDESDAHYRSWREDWPRLLREESPAEVRVNVVRIGDTVICTNPAELFSEFALAIRETSAARVTLISQLTDGYVGYVATPDAFKRGGYEIWPSGTSKLIPEAGNMIVDATADLLRRAL